MSVKGDYTLVKRGHSCRHYIVKSCVITAVLTATLALAIHQVIPHTPYAVFACDDDSVTEKQAAIDYPHIIN